MIYVSYNVNKYLFVLIDPFANFKIIYCFNISSPTLLNALRKLSLADYFKISGNSDPFIVYGSLKATFHPISS